MIDKNMSVKRHTTPTFFNIVRSMLFCLSKRRIAERRRFEVEKMELGDIYNWNGAGFDLKVETENKVEVEECQK